MQTKNKTKKKNHKYPNGKKLKTAIIVTRWNPKITEGLLKNALSSLRNCNLSDKNIKIIYVAGSIEIPYAVHKLAQSKKYDFLIALGCVIRGDTPHFDYVCKMVQEGVLKVMIEDDIPIGFGVLTVNNIKQVKQRIHVGGEAAMAGLELALIK